MMTTNKTTSKMKPFRFGIVGEFQSGKSLLINCLLCRSVATVGVGNATTHTVVNYRYAEKEHIEYLTDEGVLDNIPVSQIRELDTRTDISVIDVYLKIELLKNFILTDMPGFGANEDDTWAAKKVLPNIDFIILVASNDTSIGANSSSFRDFRELQKHNIPYYLILNCTNNDRWRCNDNNNINIAKTNLGLLSFYKPTNYPLEENGINIINFMWYWYSICNNDDELINRQKNQNSFMAYGINNQVKKEVGEASNFKLIKRIFDMDNRAFLELKRDIKYEIARLREELCPIGSIQAFAFDKIPYGWLPCDGHIYSIIEYNELYHTIGTTFGGDGKEHFKVPDLRNQFIRGWTLNNSERKLGSIQNDAIQGHGHTVKPLGNTSYAGSHTHQLYYTVYKVGSNFGKNDMSVYEIPATYYNSLSRGGDPGTTSSGSHSHSLPEFVTEDINSMKDYKSVRIDNETRPKNIALLYCIKAI